MATPTRPKLSPSGSTLGTPGGGPSSLGMRVSKLLGSTFEDAGTRTALETLSKLSFAGAPDADVDGTGTTEEGKGKAKAGVAGLRDLKRGGLRREVEGRMAERSREFLAIFTEVNDRLAELQGHLDEMNECCDEVQTKLDSANTGTKYLLEHAEGLRQQSASTVNQQLLAQLFLSRFTLTPDEIACLTSRDHPVDRDVFAAMDRCLRIRSDCAVLLSEPLSPTSAFPPSRPFDKVDGSTADSTPRPDVTETRSGPQAGMDIMTATSEYLEKGYTKLFRWCAFESRAGLAKGGEAQTEVSWLMREAVKRLKRRPEMLEDILSSLSATRSQALLTLFLDALTRGGPSGLPRPIELHAHDPLRYVGDMLAWVHQAMAGEHELLESLFGLRSHANRRVGETRTFSPRAATFPDSATTDGPYTPQNVDEVEAAAKADRDRVRRMLDRNLEGCARPLRVRVNQTIRSQEGSIVTYQLATLLHFYKLTMDRSIGADALLSRTLSEITDTAYGAFFETLHAEGRSLLRFIQPPPADLSAPTSLHEALSTLREIMSVYATSLVVEEGEDHPATPKLKASGQEDGLAKQNPVEEPGYRQAHFGEVLEAALDPALSMCERMAEQRPATWDRSIFLVNCIELSQIVLDPYGFTSPRRKELQSRIEGYLDSLTNEHYGNLLKDSGLQPIVTAIDATDSTTPLSHRDEASPQALQTSLRAFDHFLASIDPLSSPKLALLATSRTASRIHHAALSMIADAYGLVWDAVMDEGNRYEFRATVLVRSKEDARITLGASAL